MSQPSLLVESSDIIREMVRRIVDRFDPEKIILFGSHARGNARPDSDVDLLVVMNFSGNRRRQASILDSTLIGTGLPTDLILISPAEMTAQKDQMGTLIHDALPDSRLLYERH